MKRIESFKSLEKELIKLILDSKIEVSCLDLINDKKSYINDFIPKLIEIFYSFQQKFKPMKRIDFYKIDTNILTLYLEDESLFLKYDFKNSVYKLY